MDERQMKKMGIQKKAECVRVVVRCRPLSKKEVNEGREKVVKMDKENGEILIQKSSEDVPKRFTFDCVYPEDTRQKDLFDETAFPIIENILEGYNGTIFAYGQTGTGKTHTMAGVLDDEELKGITPRSFETIFKSINIDNNKQYLVRASYLEIYKEEVLDLLNKNGVQKLELKEKPGSGVYVKDLSTALVETPDKMMDIMLKGNKNRHVGQTKMNHESSRSHSIFTITVECGEVGADGKSHIRVGKLNMVDLAGSEKQSKTGSEGLRLEEAIKINLSLTTLCHVISSLVDQKSQYVPYRDSKLTRLLQDSLGGNTKTVMIANIGPADYNQDETLSTLRYASRAKHIQNKPRINEDPKDAMLREFQDEINRLKQQLQMAGGAHFNADGTVAPGGVVEVEKIVYEEDKKQMKKLEEKLEREKQIIKQKAEEQRKKIIEQKNLAEDERQQLLDDLKKKEEDQEKAKTKQQKLLKRLKNMEEKVLMGDEVMNKAMKQEIELQKTKAELEEKRREQLRIKQELKEAEDKKVNLQKEYHTQQEELAGKKNEYQKIWEKYRGALGEKNDLEIDIQRERESLMMRIRELTNEIRLKHLIIDNYIPAAEYVKIERRAEWNEELKEWKIPNLEYTGNNIKKNKKMQKEGKKLEGLETNFLYEHILNFEEDSEEEDYKEAATQRVQSMINNILVEEGEDEQLAATLSEQSTSVYYRYTDNGAEREDPEATKKKKDKKKKSTKSGKRPITAKKMKKGDIVSMVETMTNAQHVNKIEGKKVSKAKMFPKAKGLGNE
jgi:kinesin family protein 3/17